MSHIAVIDADLIWRRKHRFPNLACMKISAYHKSIGDDVTLITSLNSSLEYDKVYLSKVFTDTVIPDEVLRLPNVVYGGTGFFYDKAAPLPYDIEHIKPDYHLYDDWVAKNISEHNGKRLDYKYYLDYSIGFLTRGCFRHCPFCVNKNYHKVEIHSPLSEFLDDNRRKICLLDDNFLGSPEWKSLLTDLQNTKKPFQFKQGLDERILTDEKCKILFSSKYDGDYIFAFDDIADADLIESKLRMIRRYTNSIPKFYVLCGFDREDKWNDSFWRQDLWDLWKRIEILMKYKCIPYIMRFNRFAESPYAGFYTTVARWCNQPNFFKKCSLREFVLMDQQYFKSTASSVRYAQKVEDDIPGLAKRYFDMKYEFTRS